ncbi:TetR family transcriptional regulator [Robbsia andropogonis]|uniref:TetR family transcriptional regulator n=1 Tax=Robbsia andropogonis TaxID=28092 RepID=A0A0F5JZN3_9BURK|nr:TetR family transcriptional regulator [Robbsia andropogonis]
MKCTDIPASPNATEVAPRRTRGRPVFGGSDAPDILLRAARDAFARRGYDATSMRGIARASGVDPALVAHHFGSKEALWSAVVKQIGDESAPLLANINALRSDSKLTCKARMEAAVLMLVEQVFRSRDVGMFFSTAATENGERLALLIDLLVRPMYEAFLPLFVAAITSKDMPEQDPTILFTLLINGISKTVAYRHLLSPFSPLPSNEEDFKHAVTQSVLAMLR